MVIFLNEDLDQVRASPSAQMGMLRLYPFGEHVEGVVDIVPRLGRAVLLKSEIMLHKMRDTLEWDNNVLTIYFN